MKQNHEDRFKCGFLWGLIFGICLSFDNDVDVDVDETEVESNLDSDFIVYHD